jgi:hypothetical protein
MTMDINIYDPDPSDVEAWMKQTASENKWPDQDWDFYVINGKNDDLLLKGASDPSCRQRDFFLHALYQLVGDYWEWNRNDDTIRERIDRLAAQVKPTASADILLWKSETQRLLAGEMEFDLYYWTDHMFGQSS